MTIACPAPHPVVVLTHAYWQRRFGGDAGVLGRDIRINGHVMTIVGVAQPGFNGVDLGRRSIVRPAADEAGADADLERSRQLAQPLGDGDGAPRAWRGRTTVWPRRWNVRYRQSAAGRTCRRRA